MGEFSGVLSSSSQDQSAIMPGASPGSSLTSVADSGPVTILGNELLIQGLFFETPGAGIQTQIFTGESGWTVDWEVNPITPTLYQNVFVVGYKTAGTGTYNGTGTVTFNALVLSQKWVASLATFKGSVIRGYIVIPTFFQ